MNYSSSRGNSVQRLDGNWQLAREWGHGLRRRRSALDRRWRGDIMNSRVFRLWVKTDPNEGATYDKSSQGKLPSLLQRQRRFRWRRRTNRRREESPFWENGLKLICVDSHKRCPVTTATLRISKA